MIHGKKVFLAFFWPAAPVPARRAVCVFPVALVFYGLNEKNQKNEINKTNETNGTNQTNEINQTEEFYEG